MSSEKGKRGVLVRLTLKDGELALRLDDVEEMSSMPKGWLQRDFITLKKLDSDRFEPRSFDHEELARFGYYIIARLNAFVKMGEAP